jgi:hypothetical protein
MNKAELFEFKLTILKMASEMLLNEYIDKKSHNHNQWLVQNDVMWRSTGVRMPYPPFPPYPTQEDVLAKANSLYKCFFLDDVNPTILPDLDLLPKSKPETAIETGSDSIDPEVFEEASKRQLALASDTETLSLPNEVNAVRDAAPSQTVALHSSNVEPVSFGPSTFEPIAFDSNTTKTFDIPPLKETDNVKPIDTLDPVDSSAGKESSTPLVQTKFGGINNWFWLSKKS